jgi:hypothetical protein
MKSSIKFSLLTRENLEKRKRVDIWVRAIRGKDARGKKNPFFTRVLPARKHSTACSL